MLWMGSERRRATNRHTQRERHGEEQRERITCQESTRIDIDPRLTPMKKKRDECWLMCHPMPRQVGVKTTTLPLSPSFDSLATVDNPHSSSIVLTNAVCLPTHFLVTPTDTHIIRVMQIMSCHPIVSHPSYHCMAQPPQIGSIVLATRFRWQCSA